MPVPNVSFPRLAERSFRYILSYILCSNEQRVRREKTSWKGNRNHNFGIRDPVTLGNFCPSQPLSSCTPHERLALVSRRLSGKRLF